MFGESNAYTARIKTNCGAQTASNVTYHTPTPARALLGVHIVVAEAKGEAEGQADRSLSVIRIFIKAAVDKVVHYRRKLELLCQIATAVDKVVPYRRVH